MRDFRSASVFILTTVALGAACIGATERPASSSPTASPSRETAAAATPTPTSGPLAVGVPTSPTPGAVTPRPQSDPSLPQWAAAPGTAACITVRDPLPPAGAICVTIASGDLDGDGTADRAVVWGDPAAPSSTGGKHQWHLAAVTPAGAYQTLFETAFFEGALRGVIDVNGDGRGQILVHVDHGASTETWQAFALVGSSLKQVTISNGLPFAMGMYGSVMHGSRFDCVTDLSGVRLLSVMGFGGRVLPSQQIVFDWTVNNYRIRAAQATLVGTATGTVTRVEMDNPVSQFNTTWPSPWQSTIRVGQCGLRLT